MKLYIKPYENCLFQWSFNPNTVYFLISALGAYEIEKRYCLFALQLEPPYDLFALSYLMLFTMNVILNPAYLS